MGPVAFLDGRMEMVEPTLATLLASTVRHLARHLRPRKGYLGLCFQIVDDVEQSLVFLPTDNDTGNRKEWNGTIEYGIVQGNVMRCDTMQCSIV